MAAYEEFDKTVEEIRKGLKDGFMSISKLAKDLEKGDEKELDLKKQAADAKLDKPVDGKMPGDKLEMVKPDAKPDDSGKIEVSKMGKELDKGDSKEMEASKQAANAKLEKPKEQKII